MTISISADFDGGNIAVVDGKAGRFDLEIRHDNQSEFYQWFYFRVDGARGVDLDLRIVNAGGSAYPGGWRDYCACVSDDDVTWVQTDTDYSDGILTIRHRPASDQVWFAYFAPYAWARHQALVAQYAAVPGVAHRVLGQSLDGRDMDLLTFGDGPVQVWLYARQHPGETMAEWWMEGALEALTRPEAADLLHAATVHVVPNMNPDGGVRGHLRTNAVGVNLNREWATPSLERSPEVFYVLEEMKTSGVDFALDVHGDEAIPHVFMAGFHGIPSLKAEQQALYDRYVGMLAARTGDFQIGFGYPDNPPGKANLTISSNQMAERFGAVAMTLEMPFKDHLEAPDAVAGWSAERSIALGRDCVATLAAFVGDLRHGMFR